MARRTTTPPTDEGFEERIVDIDVSDEMQGSFLEYAYSVIYSRALPDARDGLKPVHRRILYPMAEMGLRPDRGHVKCARVVGDVMGKLHPHGDGAIYDALVRMAQPFSMRLPLIDGHGNFGSLDDAPAAMRYTECRLAAAAMLMTDVHRRGRRRLPAQLRRPGAPSPSVLPAAFPNLLVNGASGIAVGMATNMPPHNLVEVVAAARHLIKHPDATLDDLMRFVPGPDLPTGGTIVGLDGIREAYETGRGTFRMRATARVETSRPRRKGIVVTELPYGVGPERVIEKIKELVQAKKLQGISDVKDLTDRQQGPAAGHRDQERLQPRGGARAALPAHADGGLVRHQQRRARRRPAAHARACASCSQVYVDHRLDVVRRRSAYRRRKARGAAAPRRRPAHRASLDIDEVIQLIRSSDDAAAGPRRG